MQRLSLLAALSVCSLILAFAVELGLISFESFRPCYESYGTYQRVLDSLPCKTLSGVYLWLLLSAGMSAVLLLSVGARRAWVFAREGRQPSAKQTSTWLSRVVRWFAVVASTGLAALLVLGLGLVRSEYRPSGASLLQGLVVAFMVASFSMCLSSYLLARPLSDATRSRTAYRSLFVAIGAALGLYLSPPWVWDLFSVLLASAAVLAAVYSAVVIVRDRKR